MRKFAQQYAEANHEARTQHLQVNTLLHSFQDGQFGFMGMIFLSFFLVQSEKSSTFAAKIKSKSW